MENNINLTEAILDEFNANYRDSQHAFDRVCEKLGSGMVISFGKTLLLNIILAPFGFWAISMEGNKKAAYKADKLGDILYSDSRYLEYIDRLDNLVDQWNASKSNRTPELKAEIKNTFKDTISYGRSVLKANKKALAQFWKDNKKYLKEDLEVDMEDIANILSDDSEKIEEPSLVDSNNNDEPVSEEPSVEEPEQECPCCGLIGYLKVTSQNLKTLHRHLVGGNWYDDHEKLAEYYEMIDDMEDAIVEIAIALGDNDVTIAEAIEKYAVLSNKEYNATEAFMLSRVYFEKLQKLIAEFKDCHPDLPSGVVSKLDEYDYWLFLESKFKISALLKNTEIDGSLMESLRADLKGRK